MLTDVPQPRDSYRRDDGGGSSTRANRSRQVFIFLSTCSRAYLKMEYNRFITSGVEYFNLSKKKNVYIMNSCGSGKHNLEEWPT